MSDGMQKVVQTFIALVKDTSETNRTEMRVEWFVHRIINVL